MGDYLFAQMERSCLATQYDCNEHVSGRTWEICRAGAHEQLSAAKPVDSAFDGMTQIKKTHIRLTAVVPMHLKLLCPDALVRHGSRELEVPL